MRKSTRDISPVYTILVEALNAHYDRTKIARATKDRVRAKGLGISPAILSGIKRGRYRLSGAMTRQIVMRICRNEEEWRALEARLLQPTSTAPDGTVYPPEVAFIRALAVMGAELVIEHTGTFPFALRPEHDNTPMTNAFRHALAAGLKVVIFLPYRVRYPSDIEAASMGDGYAACHTWVTFNALKAIAPGQVGLYCLDENPCPVPDTGIRFTALVPDKDPVAAWIVPKGRSGDTYEFVPTSAYPKDVIVFLFFMRKRTDPLPTQEELEHEWTHAPRGRRITPTRPCPIRRVL